MVLGTDTYSSSRLPLYKSIICRNRTGVNLHVISSRHTNMLLWLEIYALYHHNRHHNGKTIICYTSKTKFSKYNCANKASTALIWEMNLCSHTNVLLWAAIYASYPNNKSHFVHTINCYSIQIVPCQNNYANIVSSTLIYNTPLYRSSIYSPPPPSTRQI